MLRNDIVHNATMTLYIMENLDFKSALLMLGHCDMKDMLIVIPKDGYGLLGMQAGIKIDTC